MHIYLHLKMEENEVLKHFRHIVILFQKKQERCSDHKKDLCRLRNYVVAEEAV